MELFSRPHRRYNPLKDEWVLVSPQRNNRPWQGQVEQHTRRPQQTYDPTCYLCPGNTRANGERNPLYDGTFVFDNDFPALLPDTPSTTTPAKGKDADSLLRTSAERGICRVICFSPRHDLTIPELGASDILNIVETWASQTIELASLPFVNHVQIFENKGAAMGCSNPHPHGQIWATEHVPSEPARELHALASYRDEHGECLLCNYLALETSANERIVVQNEYFVALAPFWASWPFETLLLSRRHTGMLPDLNRTEKEALADIMRRLTIRYDNLFGVSFPYSMGFHQSPTDGAPHHEAHLHAHYYPPLLRDATVRKFMVGYEMLGNAQRDLTPEKAAWHLRQSSEELDYEQQ